MEGLGAADFKVFEDGRPQEIDSVEFVRIEPNTPDAERRDPNSQAEANALAADPRNRVFVVYSTTITSRWTARIARDVRSLTCSIACWRQTICSE